MSALLGKHILLVEDEFLVAMLASDTLADEGAVVLGPAATLAQALALVKQETIDLAVLDVNLNGERSEPVADALTARRIPFVVLTGYGQEGWRGPPAPILDKPYTPERLITFLTDVLSEERRER
jgi:CheY-like chemotaxis protein